MTNLGTIQSNVAGGSAAQPSVAAERALATAKSAQPRPSNSTAHGAPSISKAALVAAAAKADAGKTPDVLASDVRAALDAQKKAGGGSPDFNEMSGRAIATVALNKTGQFTRAEQHTAKAALREETRQEVASSMSGMSTSAGLAAYSRHLMSDYDAASDEEREARGWTPAVRSKASEFVQSASGATSLWDQIGS